MKLLVAEKDSALAEFIQEQLESELYRVELAYDRATLLSRIETKIYDLAIIGLESPLELLRQVRALRPELLLAVLSDKNDPNLHLSCLDEGADDFIVKPFYVSVLRARFRALWRRRNNASTEILCLGDLELNRVRRTVKRNGYPVELTQKEFALLEFLMERPMQPVSRALIAESAWHLPSAEVSNNTVDVYVNYVRKKLNSCGEAPLIRTIRGIGYQIGAAEPRQVASD